MSKLTFSTMFKVGTFVLLPLNIIVFVEFDMCDINYEMNNEVLNKNFIDNRKYSMIKS